MSTLDEAIDKLISAKEHRMPALMELASLLFVGVARDRGFVASLAKQTGLRLSAGMLAVYARHRALTVTGSGLVRWDTALASELSNGRLEETTAPKQKLTDVQADVVAGMMRLGTKRDVAEPIVASLPATLDQAHMFGAALKQLGAE